MTVLQKELVQVQTLMDSMAREREEESERYKLQYQELLENHTTAGVKSPHIVVITIGQRGLIQDNNE